eukprot:2618877-Amphidinium_carterae.1
MNLGLHEQPVRITTEKLCQSSSRVRCRRPSHRTSKQPLKIRRSRLLYGELSVESRKAMARAVDEH